MAGSKQQSESGSTQGVWQGQSPYLSGLYQQGQANLGGAMGNTQNMMNTIMPAWQNQINPQGNPYLAQMGQSGLDQLNRNFQNNIMPGITSGAMGSGSLGSSRQGIAQGLAAQGVAQAGGDFLNNLYGQQYQQDQNRAMSAMQMLPMLQGSQWGDLQNLAGIIGGPTVLGESSSNSKRIGGGFGAS